jgi:hypothetical protein
MKRIASTALLVLALSLVNSAPATADQNQYLDALDAAGVLSQNGSSCNMINGICHGQFPSASAALQTGKWVCNQVSAGKPKSMIIDWLSHGEGLMPSSYNGRVITNAAISYLC